MHKMNFQSGSLSVPYGKSNRHFRFPKDFLVVRLAKRLVEGAQSDAIQTISGLLGRKLESLKLFKANF